MKEAKPYAFRAKVWLYRGGAGSWHFLTLPKKTAREIKQRFDLISAGWGSLPVAVIIGATSWETSIFPDRQRESYLLPLKASVRKAEKLKAGRMVSVSMRIRTN